MLTDHTDNFETIRDREAEQQEKEAKAIYMEFSQALELITSRVNKGKELVKENRVAITSIFTGLLMLGCVTLYNLRRVVKAEKETKEMKEVIDDSFCATPIAKKMNVVYKRVNKTSVRNALLILVGSCLMVVLTLGAISYFRRKRKK